MAKRIDIYAQQKGDDKTRRRLAAARRAEAIDIDKLAKRADFKRLMAAILDDLSFNALDTQPLTDWGQGVREAANRIKIRLLASAEGAKMLAEITSEQFMREHKSIQEAIKTEEK